MNSLQIRVLVVVGLLVTLSMGIAVAVGVRRWRALDRGQRWIVVGLAIFLGLAFLSLGLGMSGRKTRLVQELPVLAGTLCFLIGLTSWQPSDWSRSSLRVMQVAFASLWVAAQFLQGWKDDFSTVSGPIHATAIMVGASVTLITFARVGPGRWTTHPWFWICIGMMVVYGTEVLLEPLMHQIYPVRADLVAVAYVFHDVFSIVGWAIVTRGLSLSPVGPGKTKVFS